MITDKEIALAKLNLSQTKHYVPVKILNLQEQIALDVFSSVNNYIKVGSTVEAPVLDEMNMLYRVEGIDTDALFATLNAHQHASRTIDREREEDDSYADAKDVESFTTYTCAVGEYNDTRAQTKKGNTLLEMKDSKQDESGLEDMNGQKNYKDSKVNRKLHKLQSSIMNNLSKLRKEYHYYKKEMNIATGKRYLQCEAILKDIFVKIKGIEKCKAKLEEGLDTIYFKKYIKPEMDELLSRFVDWQQRQLEKGIDPMMTREEAIIQLKPKYFKYVKQYEGYC